MASKLGIRIGHIEAGLRSFDRAMPEEINRVLTDQISDLLFIHSPEARENLAFEGVPPGRVHPVGNTMIDTLVAMRSRISEAQAAERRGLTQARTSWSRCTGHPVCRRRSARRNSRTTTVLDRLSVGHSNIRGAPCDRPARRS